MHQDDRNSRRDRFRETAASQGVGGARFISESEDDDFLRGLRLAVKELIANKLVSAESMQKLHPDIDPELAESLASQASLGIIQRKYQQRIGHTRIGSADFMQVIAGTRMATYEGLNAIAFALDTPAKSIIERARVLALLPPPEDEIGD